MSAKNTTKQAQFNAGANHPDNGAATESQPVSRYMTSPSEPTTPNFRRDRVETHYDSDPAGRPAIPESSNGALCQNTPGC